MIKEKVPTHRRHHYQFFIVMNIFFYLYQLAWVQLKSIFSTSLNSIVLFVAFRAFFSNKLLQPRNFFFQTPSLTRCHICMYVCALVVVKKNITAYRKTWQSPFFLLNKLVSIAIVYPCLPEPAALKRSK